jgi:hypothetical protein
MIFFIIFQFIISISLAIFLSRKIFEYDNSIIRRNKIILTSIALFLLIFAVISSQVTPKVGKYFFMKEIEKAMMKNPMFIGIKDYDAKLYQGILDEASDSFDKGTVKKEMIANISTITGNLLLSKLPIADDDLIIEYTKLTIKKVKYLQSHTAGSCFNVLFPKPGTGFDNKLLTQDFVKTEVDIFNKLLKRPKRKNKILDELGLFELIGPVYIKLEKIYPKEILNLENPYSPDVNKEKFCDLVIDLYTDIIKLPENDAGSVLRTMLAAD